ncbi:MAG TPA: N-glycosylase/DNA lyase [Candidatus Acidoferrales bacterium]|nr:N-glycosylase/DNA lyase [Candidatus Acidoferrales bacterium]
MTAGQKAPPVEDASATDRRREFALILAKIPKNAWRAVVHREPEWQSMAALLPAWGFGPFSALMVAAGLNDYFLKGKAEIVYWPRLRESLLACAVPASPGELLSRLLPFYESERAAGRKLPTLKRFLASPLAERLWNATPQELAADISSIRRALAETLAQDENDKQIVFAMKCLGLALLMAGEERFDSSSLPLPGDSRLRKLTRRLGFDARAQRDMQKFWQSILDELHRAQPELSMIHLDSLLWQIAPLERARWVEYFSDLGIAETGASLEGLLKN